MTHADRFQGDGAVDLDGVGTGDGPDTGTGLRNPRDLVAVLEPDTDLAHHLDTAPEPFDSAVDARAVMARWHEVRDPDGAGGSVPFLVEHERVLPVRPPGGKSTAPGCEQPAPIVRGTEEGGKAGRRVEPRDA